MKKKEIKKAFLSVRTKTPALYDSIMRMLREGKARTTLDHAEYLEDCLKKAKKKS